MPWCPKCKSEYVEGVKKCADCKCDLVDKLTKSAMIDALKEEAVEDTYDTEESLADTNEETEASEPEKQITREEFEAMVRARRPQRPGVYVRSAARAEDNKSSGYTLLIVGILGMAALILIMTGIIPIWTNSSSRFLTYGVMGLLFIVFILSGISSLKNAKKYEQKAEFEQSLTEEIKTWCRENLSASVIDGMLSKEERMLPEELIYFRRVIRMKERIGMQYVNVDGGLIDQLIEELYSEFFEQE